MVDPKEAFDKLADRILAYKPVKVKGSLLKKVGVTDRLRKKKSGKNSKQKRKKPDD